MKPMLDETLDYTKKLIKHLIFRLNEDDIASLSAQCAYYLFLSLFSFVIFLFSILSFTQIPQAQLMSLVFSFFPSNIALVIRGIIEDILSTRNVTLLTVGALATIWSSSSGINAVRKGLYKAYRKFKNRPFWQVIIVNLLSTISLALILFITIIFLVSGEVLKNQLFEFLNIPNSFDFIWNIIRILIPFITMAIVFTLLYLLIPHRKVRIIEVLPGTLITIVAWISISLVFSFYVNNFTNYANIYGSISGIILLLVWLNLSCLFLLLGGEINAAIAYFNSSKGSE